METITKSILDQYVEEGWLIKQDHPTLPLTIYNYSQATQYAGKWDEITLSCRGLVIDDQGRIMARPFKKFFNIEEGKHTSTSEFNVYEKMDGSLIIIFWYDGGWVVASRGSFISDQAINASQIFFNELNHNFSIGITYLFEFTAAWNRIVVDYGEKEKLTLLGAIRTENGEEASWDVLKGIATGSNCDVVKKYDGVTDFNKLKELNTPNREGFVVHFSNGDRCKIKFEDYVTLHKIITNVSSYDIWENLKTFGKLDETLLTNIPDEFYDWVCKVESTLLAEYHVIETEYKCIYDKIRYHKAISRVDSSPSFSRRAEFAMLAKRYARPNILFAMYDEKDYSQMIWRMIKPEYQKPFSNKNLES
jgi:RNA ligase